MQKKGFFGITRRSDFINRLYILFFASVFSPFILLFLGLGRYQKPNSYASPYVIFPEWFTLLVAISCIGIAFLGLFLYKKRIPDAKSQVLLRWKVQRFLRASSYKYTTSCFCWCFCWLGILYDWQKRTCSCCDEYSYFSSLTTSEYQKNF